TFRLQPLPEPCRSEIAEIEARGDEVEPRGCGERTKPPEMDVGQHGEQGAMAEALRVDMPLVDAEAEAIVGAAAAFIDGPEQVEQRAGTLRRRETGRNVGSHAGHLVSPPI